MTKFRTRQLALLLLVLLLAVALILVASILVGAPEAHGWAS
jgi:hypothetical protein